MFISKHSPNFKENTHLIHHNHCPRHLYFGLLYFRKMNVFLFYQIHAVSEYHFHYHRILEACFKNLNINFNISPVFLNLLLVRCNPVFQQFF